MTIERVRVDHFRIPLPVTLSDSTHGAITHFDLVAVRIADKDGLEGLGYTYTVNLGGGAVADLLSRDVAGTLIGQDPERIEAIWKRLWWHLHYVGRGGLAVFAISAVDIALWDLKGKRLDRPLWRLLGGADPDVRAYAGGIDLYFTLDELLAQTDRNLANGFRAIKMKVGRERLSEDVDRVRAMRRHLGDGFPLMADANMRWTADQAVRAAKRLADQDLVWLEEPTVPDDYAGHGRILRDGGVPIAAGENLRSIVEFEHMMAAGGVSFPEPDASNCGGVTPWMKVAAMAEARGLPVTSHGIHDIHVHLLAAVPNASFLEVHGFGLERFMAEPLVIRDGIARAPDRPGHGVALDFKALEAHRG